MRHECFGWDSVLDAPALLITTCPRGKYALHFVLRRFVGRVVRDTSEDRLGVPMLSDGAGGFVPVAEWVTADIELSGLVKFDGCCNFDVQQGHICGVEEYEQNARALHRVYEIAAAELSEWCGRVSP